MTLPHNVARDYSGGVVTATQLTAEIGSTDLSFNIASTTGWTNANGDPLGTAGPFTTVIDLGTPSVEKILCSSVNLSSGLVTVYNSGGTTGRGYDQTTAQAHVPGTSQGIQPCWSATEAAEANAAVVFGPGGGAAIIGLTGNPAGRIHAITGTFSNVLSPVLNTVATDFLVGSMTRSAHGLIAPVTAYYRFDCTVEGAKAGTTDYVVLSYARNNVTVSAEAREYVTSGNSFSLSLSDIIHCTAGDTIDPRCQIGSGTATMSNANTPAYNFVSASIVST